jgi:nucleoside-diphosphate-sugar epimerase
MTDNDRLVLVTGAGGFLASHIVKQLLEHNYRVRGSVRNINDKNEVSFLKYLIENKKYPLEICEADLVDERSWINAVKDCAYVIHTASPVLNYVPDDANEVI